MLPIVSRELTVTARRRSTYLVRVGAATLALLAMLWLVMVTAASGGTATLGKMLFDTVSGFAFACSLLAGVGITSDCLSAEKREGTLGLLFLTDLKGYDVILGKLISSSVVSFYGLLATVPVISIAILLGGVSLGRVLTVSVVLMNTMFFSLSAGLFISSLSRNERKAAFATFVLVAGFTLLPVVGIHFYEQFLEVQILPAKQAVILLPSPLLSLVMTLDTTLTGAGAAPFPIAVPIILIHLLGWGFLAVAGLVLPRTAQERPKGRRGERWVGFKRRWTYGSGEKRVRHRRELLDRNPILWLASRDRNKPRYVWFFLGIFFLLWLWGAWNTPAVFLDWDAAAWGLWFLHGFLKIWFASEVCHLLIEDRRAGALELLLATPMRVRDIARGHELALMRQFLWPAVLLLVLDVAVLLRALQGTGHEYGAILLAFLFGMTVFVLDLVTIQWVGMWAALSTGNLNRALHSTCFRVLLAPWLIFAAIMSLVGSYRFLVSRPVDVQPVGLVLLWAFISIAVDLAQLIPARRKFLTRFRTLAASDFNAPRVSAGASPRAGMFRALTTRSRPAERRIAWGTVARRHWILTSVGLLVFLASSGLFLYRRHLHSRIGRELAAISARGEPAFPSDFDKWHPPVPEGENAAVQLTPLLNTGYLTPLPRGTNIDATVLRNADALRQVHEISRLPRSRFDMNWSDQARIPYMRLHRVGELARLLNFEAALRIHASDTNGAVESIETILRLARILRQEPMSQAQFESRACLDLAITATETVLTATALDGTLLDRLITAFGNAENETLDLKRWIRAAVAERYLLIRFHEAGAAGIGPWTGGGGLSPAVHFLFGLEQLLGMWDLSLLKTLPIYEAQIAALKLPHPENFERMKRLPVDAPARDPISMFVPFPRPTIPTFTGVLSDMGLIDRIRLARFALAVERSRIASGHLPQQLPELVPAFIGSIPSPLSDPRPFGYERLPTGYRIQFGTNVPPRNRRIPRVPVGIPVFTVGR
jgi:ABC-type transport system involved in multi-copper enzyme maturation permease subunit